MSTAMKREEELTVSVKAEDWENACHELIWLVGDTELFERISNAARMNAEQRPRSTPKPEPVGWETDAEWDLEMRCCNITEATPFAEVSKLINDLWQQYCLAAEPKPDAANARNTALEEAAKLIDQYMLCGVGADVLLPRGNSGNKVGLGYAAAIRALKAEGESRTPVDNSGGKRG